MDRPRSLKPELLSGRSLAPPPRRRRAAWREHRRVVAVVVVLVVVLVSVGAGKLLAERAADRATQARSDHLGELLEGSTPEDFLAFGASVRTPGSLAAKVRAEDGFVNVDAKADRTFIRIQPTGWWSGFTERCLVAVVRSDGVTITVPKTQCVRVGVPDD